MTASRLVPTACLLLALPQQVYRSDVRTVPVYATVTDARGALVTSLTAADFEVRDDGQSQPIDTSRGVGTIATSAALDEFQHGWADDDAPAISPDALIDTLKSLKDSAPAWIEAAGVAERRRRRLTVATYVLHLLRSQEDPYLWQGGGSPFLYRRPLPAVELLEWACGLLRDEPPIVAERWWHLGAIALLERHAARDALALHLNHARARFPAEERWALAAGIAGELATWPERRDDRALEIGPALASMVTGRYEAAAALSSVRAEALIRLGYLDLRRNRIDAALARFAQAGAPADRTLRYWLELFRGQALARANRTDEAVASFRAALDASPFAQSAVLALASALATGNRDAEASALVARALAITPSPPDPWAEYVLPDWRFWSRVNAELRKTVTR